MDSGFARGGLVLAAALGLAALLGTPSAQATSCWTDDMEMLVLELEHVTVDGEVQSDPSLWDDQAEVTAAGDGEVTLYVGADRFDFEVSP